MEHVDGRGDMDGVADINGARGGKYGWCPGQEIWVGNEEYGIRF